MFQKINTLFLSMLLISAIKTLSASSPATLNQTSAISPIHSPDSVPFEVSIKLANFSLPHGLQSFAFGLYEDKCLLVAGRTNGLHGFDAGNDNFLPKKQNTTLYVLDLTKKQVSHRSLLSKNADLSEELIDALSVTSPLFDQTKDTLYVVGGYGVNSETGKFSTKSTLTALDLPGLIEWVENPHSKKTAKKWIRQISDPIFKVTGGYLGHANPHSPFLIVFGQDFQGYYTSGSNGIYTEQVRSFNLVDDGENLAVFAKKHFPKAPFYRRRDLNVVPIMQKKDQSYEESFVALSGVFTVPGGIWTVPVFISSHGKSFMPNPHHRDTFKQGMNNYASATAGLFSKKSEKMHVLILGGLSFETYSGGVFSTDAEIPFTNNITNISIDEHNQLNQSLMDAEYPVIPSTSVNPGNPLLFGAGAAFIPNPKIPTFNNNIIRLDDLKEKTLLGYVVGGIASTVPNTSFMTDTSASSYIFQVFFTPK
jgi:hypothetical protein